MKTKITALILLAFASTAALAQNVRLTSELRTPTITTATSSGTVTAGARNVTFIFSSTFTGTILGVAYTGAADSSQTFDAGSADHLAAIAYTVTAGSVRIVDVR